MDEIERFFNFIFLKGSNNFEIRILSKPKEKINFKRLELLSREFDIMQVKNSLYPPYDEMYAELCKSLSKRFNVYLALQPKNLEKVKLDNNNTKDKAIHLEHIGIDIDKMDKSNGTSKKDKTILYNAVKEVLDEYKISNYMIVDSGNGFHIWIKLLQTIPLNEKTLTKVEKAYKKFLSKMNVTLMSKTKGLFSIDKQARDISRILRIAGTINYKAKGTKKVKLVEIKVDKKDYAFDKYFSDILSKTKIKEKNKVITKDVINYEENFYENPLVKLWLEEDLPDDTDKHNTIGYALQSLVHYLGLEHQVADIEQDINSLQSTNLHLNYCTSPIELNEIYTIALKWCKKHYPKYVQIFKNELKKIEEENKE